MTSHEYAKQLRTFADTLESKPEFVVPGYFKRENEIFNYFYDKDDFIAAVRVLGAGTKTVQGDQFVFTANVLPGVKLQIERSKVCKLVKPAEYDCVSLLDADEQAQVDQAAAGVAAEADDIPF